MKQSRCSIFFRPCELQDVDLGVFREGGITQSLWETMGKIGVIGDN